MIVPGPKEGILIILLKTSQSAFHETVFAQNILNSDGVIQISLGELLGNHNHMRSSMKTYRKVVGFFKKINFCPTYFSIFVIFIKILWN